MLEQHNLSSNFPTTNLDGHLQCNIKFKSSFLAVTQSCRKIKKPLRESSLTHTEQTSIHYAMHLSAMHGDTSDHNHQIRIRRASIGCCRKFS